MKSVPFEEKKDFKSILKQSLLLFIQIQLYIFIAQLILAPIGVLIGLILDDIAEQIMLGVTAFILKFVACFLIFYRKKYDNKNMTMKYILKVLLISLAFHLLLVLIFHFQAIFSGTDISIFAKLWANATVPQYQLSKEYKDIPIYIFLVLSIAEFLSIIGSAVLGYSLAGKKHNKERNELHKQ